ncbi:hypothetical protein Q0590_18185 [Rhodocytophaga aerolata]|uniref:Cupin n=1 Tax=Rhodocytophaga aerolata TaxID=455078 RepID=A0ABT8RA43_9BACT|nr:hypothetical protein [Rhodocytophaga aerolata]MDO1448209.1 hypothetical protein [Rhodocytophaga aerolata]
MIIQEVLTRLETAEHPVALALHKGKDFRALIIGMKKGMVLKEHKASVPSKLTVLSGQVTYAEAKRQVKLSQYETLDIPVEVFHEVEALQDSLCLLTQG